MCIPFSQVLIFVQQLAAAPFLLGLFLEAMADGAAAFFIEKFRREREREVNQELRRGLVKACRFGLDVGVI